MRRHRRGPGGGLVTGDSVGKSVLVFCSAVHHGKEAGVRNVCRMQDKSDGRCWSPYICYHRGAALFPR